MTRTEQSAPLRAATYVAGLAVVLVGALGVGRAVGPIDVAAEPAHAADESHGDTDGGTDGGEHGSEHGSEHGDEAALTVAGLAQEVDGYRLELAEPRTAAGSRPFGFIVVGPDDEPVTDFVEAHERDLHLIAVRRDLTGFQHVHPTLDEASGVWTTTLALDPGSWRVLADFVPAGGEQVVLGADLVAEGAGSTTPLGDDVLDASVDGYDVALDLSPVAGGETEIVATVTRAGRPVTDLGQYLGELGHLVVLRDGDLAYVHGHPAEDPGTGPTIPFAATFPSGGRYRLFLEFEHDGAVHTAAFTVSVEAGDGDEH